MQKLLPVNEEVFQLDPNDALMPKYVPNRDPHGASNPENKGQPGNKDLELFDLGKARFDPIAALRDKQQKTKEDGYDDDEIGGDTEEEDWRQNNREEEPEDRKRDDDDEHYSDIDEKFEKKLKNNEYRPDEDIFEELLGQAKKPTKNLEEFGLDNSERPVWEDVDTNKVIEDIKNRKIDFLSHLPQDKGAIFGEQPKLPEATKIPKTLLNRFQNQQPQPQQILQPQEPKTNIFKEFGTIDFGQLAMEIESKPVFKEVDEQNDIFKAALSEFSGTKPTDNGTDEATINNFINSLNIGGAPNNNNFQNRNPQQQQMQGRPQEQYNQPSQHQNQQINQGQGNSGYRPNNQQINNQQPNRPQQQQLQQQGGQQQPQQIQKPGQKFKRNPMYPSFIFKYYSNDYMQEIWHYLDKDKKQQGPYTGELMDRWYEEGLLPMDLKVTIGQNTDYKTIKELAEFIVYRTINGDGPPPPKKTEQASLVSELLKTKPELLNVTGDSNVAAKTLDEIEIEAMKADMLAKQQAKKLREHDNVNKKGGKKPQQGQQRPNQPDNQNDKNKNYNNNQYQQKNIIQNNNNVNKPNVVQNQNQNNQNQPIDNPTDVASQLKNVLGMFNKPNPVPVEKDSKNYQAPKIEIDDFPALS
jgi:hypothetical protein